MKECALCGKSVEKFHRKYKGKGYCSTCYAYLFKKKKCSQCGESKRIYRYIEPPVCQQCELKNQPCIRCGKINFSIGKITEYGAVCNSCSKYYRPKKKCSICGNEQRNVSKRLKYGELEPICEKCFNKKHFVTCFKCKQRKAPFLYDINRNPYCKPCATKPDKKCKVCRISMPAGINSNTCYDCHALDKIRRVLSQHKEEICQITYQLYRDYSDWLLDRREPPFTSRQIIRDYEVFLFLDNWLTQKNTWPTYEEYAKALTVKKTRKHLLTTTFLNDHKVFSIDEKIKGEVGDLDTIIRLLERIPTESDLRPYIDGYYAEMLCRYEQGKTSARSFRLALTPAVAILELGLRQDKTTPDDELIKQYLWLHYGQRAAITGFINFLKKITHLDLKLPNQKYFQFKRPKESRTHIKQKLIAILRSDDFSEELYIETAIEYFHNIQFPNQLTKPRILTNLQKKKILKLVLAGKKFFIPNPKIKDNNTL